MAQISCDIVANTLTTLKKPSEGARILWSLDAGDRNLTDRLVAGMVDPTDSNIIAAGERFYAEGQNIGLTLRKIDSQGRSVWDKIINNRNFEKIIEILPLEKGFAVLANQGGRHAKTSAWLGFFDGEGTLLNEVKIAAPAGALSATAILPLNNAKSFWLAGQVRDGAEAPYSVLYRLDRKGQVSTRKAYRFGPENALLSIALAKGGSLYGGGYILDEKNRRNAWLARFGEDGGLMWQRPLPRGKGATIRHVQAFESGGVLAAGHSTPYDLKTPESTHQGGWIGLFDEVRGDPVWERFFSEPDHALSIPDFSAGVDGRTMVLMDAARPLEAPEAAPPAFARLIDINKRGEMLNSRAFLNGEGLGAHRLLTNGTGGPVILGHSLVPYKLMVKDPAKPAAPPTQKSALARQGFALSTPGPDEYEDPCP